MVRRRGELAGFTLIELMVSLAVLAILIAMAAPSFLEFQQRSALRGAADQIVSFWGNARFEALRRNAPVKVVFNVVDATGAMCLGATTADVNNDTVCDCFTAGSCNVGAFPTSGGQAEWERVITATTANATVAKPTLGNTDTDFLAIAAIDPKRGGLTDSADAGFIELQSPSGSRMYRLRIHVDRNGRAVVCEPTHADTARMPAFADRPCQ